MKASIQQADTVFQPITLSLTANSQEEYDFFTLLMSLTYDDVVKVIQSRIDMGQEAEAPIPPTDAIHFGEGLTAIRAAKEAKAAKIIG
jgi:hypothetical protein